MTNAHDKFVLDTIFNPYLPLEEEVNCQSTVEVNEQDNKDSEVQRLEVAGVAKAEAGEVEAAVTLLTNSLKLSSVHTRVSVLNNRAQVYRLLGNDDAALADLNAALAGGMHKEQSRARVQALCQRALILRHRGQMADAHQDLQAASNLGSAFAKQMLVQTNPYAAMCNQMLMQMFTNLKDPYQSPTTNNL